MSKRPAVESAGPASSKKSKVEVPAALPEATLVQILNIENELKDRDDKMRKEQRHLMVKYLKEKSPLFKKRGDVLRDCDHFWGPVLANGLDIFTTLSKAESTFLRENVADFIVEDCIDDEGSYRITLKLKDSPNYSPSTLVKEVTLNDGTVSSTPVKTELKFCGPDSENVYKQTEIENGVFEATIAQYKSDLQNEEFDFDGPLGATCRSLLKWFNEDTKADNESDDSEELDTQGQFNDILRQQIWQYPVPFFAVENSESDQEE
eukprot:GHVH01006604.1.p2 GENE.GHVH01006604.1~~GHVH01006604.1.p2  ORF type:complete len:263 (+),score=56.20 GHVH01006604.1:2492-3280(+)